MITVAAVCAPLAFFAMFSGMARYDDEGYLLILLRQYSHGAVLYDQLYGQYGPAYFQLVSWIFAALRIGFTHVTGRGFTMGVWICIAALCGGGTFRLTRNLPIALCTQLLVFTSLQLRNEPPHPGGLLCLLLSGVVFVGTWLRPGRRIIPALVMGALLAVIMLVKINVGVFALASTLFTLLAGSGARRGERYLRRAAAFAMPVVPLVLTVTHWSEPGVGIYAAVVACAALAVVLTALWSASRDAVALRDIAALMTSFALTVLVSISVELVHGTTVSGLVNGMVLDAMNQPETYSVPLELPSLTPVVAVLGVLLALFSVRARGNGQQPSPGGTVLGAAMQLLAGAAMWTVALGRVPAYHFAVSLPLLWWPLATAGTPPEPQRPGKLVLVALAVLQTLHAYPVAGSHLTWATFLFIPVGAIGIADGWRGLCAATYRTGHVKMAHGRLVNALLATAILGLSARSVYEQGRTFKHDYDDGVPLNLPGAQSIRLPAPWVSVLHWLTATVSSRCLTFVSMPALNSLYLFTGMEPPIMLNIGTWMTKYSAAQQAAIRDRFAQAPPPRCVVRNRALVRFWTQGRDISESPLGRYIDEQFVVVTALAGYEVMTQRNAAAVDYLPSPVPERTLVPAQPPG